ncbi:helicase associated domain-containing protein [Ohtaekwangia sp.]|uniref:helicase associated domain-containing protein n=1 Tax=Ohtaekwangia sp. TaxID=2066019 RepID=UPI002FDD06C0
MEDKDRWKENFSKLKAYRKQHGNFNVSANGSDDKAFNRWVENIRKHPERLPAAIYTRLLKIGFPFKIAADWNNMFSRLEQFYRKHGHSQVSAREDEKLFDWCVNQRNSQARLSSRQVEKLNDLDFDWLVSDKDLRWLQMFEQLVAFKQEYGHAKVPQDFKGNPALGVWVARQRRAKTRGELSADKVSRLEEIGFLWKEDIAKLREENWEKKYSELIAYKREHGHIDRIKVRKDNYSLGLWIESQIVHQKNIPSHRKKKLDAIGFAWSKGNFAEERWEEMYKRLQAYARKHGHCRVKRHQDFTLSVWVQRNKRDRSSIGREKRKKLEALGVKWPHQYFHENWESLYKQLKAFRKEHGHLSVNKSQTKLYEWIQTQKRLKKENKIPADREQKLTALGFIWKGDAERRKLEAWDALYTKFKALQKKYGDRYHLKLKEHPELDEWVTLQLHSKKKLSAYKRDKLDAIGFLWDRTGYYWDARWEKMYEQLVIFKKKFGHCDVPQSYTENRPLASWVNGQRTKKLPANKRKKLEALGFSWAHQIGQKRWLDRLKEYTDLKKKNKHTSIPVHTPLYSWLYQQRKNYSKLPPERRKLLARAGITAGKK